eukprot:gnl/Chilomastix_cuspidata/5211.p1 GENE.gnl/Chilomastix_cuspidata/5211~~gnl/Chilomastix_cuspidata/5211.p1  ORF type:complete len:239 (+),score=134.70 gnl/Chilomastix_cuspidata/5211:549-1265(+)
METGESIFNLVRDERAPAKPRRLAKPHKTTYPLDGRKPAATMGPSKTLAPKPDEFLKSKHITVDTLPRPAKFEYKDGTRRKPPVPTREDKPVTLQRERTDFIRMNKANARLAVPAPRPGEPADYTQRAGFGEVPAYLAAVKQQVAEEYALIAEVQAAEERERRQRRARFVKLPDEERARLLGGLRANFEELNREFMTLKLGSLTLKQTQRRHYLERRLHELELQIARLEKDEVLIEVS